MGDSICPQVMIQEIAVMIGGPPLCPGPLQMSPLLQILMYKGSLSGSEEADYSVLKEERASQSKLRQSAVIMGGQGMGRDSSSQKVMDNVGGRWAVGFDDLRSLLQP